MVNWKYLVLLELQCSYWWTSLIISANVSKLVAWVNFLNALYKQLTQNLFTHLYTSLFPCTILNIFKIKVCSIGTHWKKSHAQCCCKSFWKRQWSNKEESLRGKVAAAPKAAQNHHKVNVGRNKSMLQSTRRSHGGQKDGNYRKACVRLVTHWPCVRPPAGLVFRSSEDYFLASWNGCWPFTKVRGNRIKERFRCKCWV